MAARSGVFVQTPRLVLRQMLERDAFDLCRIVTTPAVGRMLFLFPLTWVVADAEEFIRHWTYRGERPFRLAIAEATGRFIGTVGVFTGPEPAIFYFLDPAFAGRGYATEAVAAFAAWLFQTFDLPALTADVFNDNPASKRVLTRLGFVETGTGTGTSAARLEPAPITFYRLDRQDLRIPA